MIKRVFNLQLFAEPTTAEPAKEAEPAKAEPTEKKAVEDKKYTDEDVDKIINRKFAEWEKKQQKAVAEAEKLANMNATQKAEYEKEQLQKELDALKKKDALAEMTKISRKMLDEKNIRVSDELLSIMVTTDAEETKKAIDAFAKSFNEAVEAAVKEKLRGEPPKKGTGSGTVAMTKEQIMAIKDPELRQKKMLENRKLFNL